MSWDDEILKEFLNFEKKIVLSQVIHNKRDYILLKCPGFKPPFCQNYFFLLKKRIGFIFFIFKLKHVIIAQKWTWFPIYTWLYAYKLTLLLAILLLRILCRTFISTTHKTYPSYFLLVLQCRTLNRFGLATLSHYREFNVDG